jgi:hypothetical protein
VSAGWVAGSVRARALARRRIGTAEARRLAACGSLGEALTRLAGTPYRIGPGVPGPDGERGRPQADAGRCDLEALAAAQHAIAEALLWDLRVLAGWLPQGGAQLMRALAGWFEIANVAERLAELSGRQPGAMFRLGALATAWPQLRRSGSPAELRSALAASAWKDPGGESADALQVGMRARWAQRVAALGEPAQTWAASALVLLLAGERFGSGRPANPVLRSVAATLLGPRAAAAGSLDDLARQLPTRLSWVLEPAGEPAGLWRAESAWWARTERDGRDLLAGSGLDKRPVLGAVVVLAADARRVGAALEIAARGGGQIEVFDAVA